MYKIMTKEVLFEDWGQDLLGFTLERVNPGMWKVVDTDLALFRHLYLGDCVEDRFLVVGGQVILLDEDGNRTVIQYPIKEIKNI